MKNINNINEDNFSKQTAIRKNANHNSILRKDIEYIPKNTIEGEVISIVGNHILVEIQIDNSIKHINCINSGTIISSNKYSNLIATGDKVNCIYNATNLCKIIGIKNRTTKFSRISPSNRNREQIIAANINSLLIFVSIFQPNINTRLIDRLLVAAKISNIEPIIIINKIDLCEPELLNQITLPYKKLKMPVWHISALKNIDIDNIKQQICNKKSVIVGTSGAGKSTFLNKILDYDAQTVREISTRTNKGTHTTSFSKRYNITGSEGWIIDTPGIREFGIWDLSKEEIGVIFPDFINHYLGCKFTSCTHTHEPGCAIIEAVENGKIAEERWFSYLNIYETLPD